MANENSNMAAVCIIYSPDGEPWFNYFDNYLRRVFPDITIEALEESRLLQLGDYNSKIRATVKQSRVNIFIVSPGYLQFCIEYPEVMLKDLSKTAKVVIFLCGTSLNDFVMEDQRGQKIADRLPLFEKQCLLSYPQHDEMLERVVEVLEPEGRSAKSREDKGDKQKANGKRKRRSKGFKLIPREVNCEGTTDVVISFDEMDASEESEIKIEVEIEGDASEDSEGPRRVKAVYLNPYTCMFTAPEHRAGVVKVSVHLQGKVLGTEELKYQSPAMDAISGIHQIYIRQINELCSLLSKGQLLELDARLARLLHDESIGVIPTGAFEYFHRVHRYQCSDVSEFELPTMFHLAARYGLRELCQQLTDLPDARYSFCTYNVDRKLPEDVARSSNHYDIASLLENLRESDTFQKLYDSYIIMNRGDLSPEYLVQGAKPGGSDDDYEDVPTEADMSAMAESRYKSHPGQKSGMEFDSSLVDCEDEDGSTCSFVEKYLQPMENPYECRFQKEKLLAPVKFIEGKATIPRNQQELIHIMEQVKNQQLTMADAEVLFKEWKIRHQKKPASVKHKENQLAKIREETGKNQKEKKDTFPFSQLLGKKTGGGGGGGSSTNQCIPEIMPGVKSQPAKPSAEGMGDRTSTASSSSRESTCSIRSRASTTSGIDVDETIQEETKPLSRAKHSNRKSVHLQKLVNELTSPGAMEPPPLPPRVTGAARPSIPLPRLERALSPRRIDKNTESPDRSYLSPDVDPVRGPSEDVQFHAQKLKHHGVDSSSKNFIHQESMPELHYPPPVNQPRKLSLPTLTLPSSVVPHRNLVSAVPEEDEPETKPSPQRVTPKPPVRYKTDVLITDELRKVIQQKAEGIQFGNKALGKGSGTLPKKQPLVPHKK